MSELVTTLREQRLNTWEQAKAVAERAAEEKRSMTADEERQWDEANNDLSKLDERIKSILDNEKRAADAAMAMDELAKIPADTRRVAPVLGEFDYAAEIRKLASAPAGTGFDLRWPTNKNEQRNLLDSNVPLPTSFVGQLYRYLIDTSTIRKANPTVFSTSSGENMVVPRATAYGTAKWTAEAGAISASDPTLSSVTLGAYKVGVLIQISNELLVDEGFDVAGFIASQAGMLIGVAVDTAYVSGTGTTQPSGFLGSASTGVQAATGTGSLVGLPTSGASIGADVLIDLYHSVIPQYRANASWLMNDQVVRLIRRLKDTTNQYLWQPALVAGQPDTLLGRPVYPDPNMPLITAASKSPIAFGDFRSYFIRDVTPLRFERSNDYAFGTDLVSFRALYRTDGVLADTSGVKLYTTAAS